MKKPIQLLIKELRKKRGLTQKKLAERLQVSFQTVSKWENGITLPDISYLPMLADIFGVSTDVLLGLKPMEDCDKWRNFDESGYWGNHMERTKMWKLLYWNDDYFSFLVQKVWNINTPVNILDFGCGYGFLGMKLLPLLPQNSTYTGIDSDNNALEEARHIFGERKKQAYFIHEDIYKYKPQNKYDIVISLFLMSYLKKPDVILEKMKNSLAENGKLILIDVNMEVEQAGYYSCIEDKEGIMRPDFTPIWKTENMHGERDYRMGTKLPYLLKSIGLKSVNARISDKVIIYDMEDSEKRELSKVFRYVHENEDSSIDGQAYFSSRNAGYYDTERYVNYYKQTKKYFDSDGAFAVSTSGIYFVWGELPMDSDKKGDTDAK